VTESDAEPEVVELEPEVEVKPEEIEIPTELPEVPILEPEKVQKWKIEFKERIDGIKNHNQHQVPNHFVRPRVFGR